LSRLAVWWRRWVHATSVTETAEVMALFRVGAGVSLVWVVVSVWVSGAAELVWTDQAFGGYRELDTTWLIDLLGGPTPGVIAGLMAVSGVAGALVTAGLGGRLAALVALQAWLPLTELNSHSGGSFEHLLTNALWLLVLCRSTATWSLDCRIRTGAWTGEGRIGAWARWLVLAQIVLVYGTTGLQKMGTSWTPIGGFTAVYYALRDPGWQRVDLPWLGWLEPVLAVATAMVWAFETGWLVVPLLLWWTWRPGTGGRLGALARRWPWRRAALAFGAAMHLGILLMLEVGAFSWLTMAFYVALWRPDELRAPPWLSRRTAPPTP
jgi:hypothetical protein